MATSRVFVQGLPPSISEQDFSKHFSQRHVITDIKLLPNRRIGYVGFKTPEDALQAIKYFNKSFIRMSRIRVELADSIQARPALKHKSNSMRGNPSHLDLPSPSKRRRIDSSTKMSSSASADQSMSSTTKSEPVASSANIKMPSTQDKPGVPNERDRLEMGNATEDHGQHEQVEALVSRATPETNADWMRNRTSHLLSLEDSDEEDVANDNHENIGGSQSQGVQDTNCQPSLDTRDHGDDDGDDNMPEAGGEDEQLAVEDEQEDRALEEIRRNRRLFLRNLAYVVDERSLTELFSPFGQLEGVHLPLDPRSGAPKGFAFVQFENADNAVQAYTQLDGTVYLGRLLHILPASSKRNSTLDDFALEKLPLKKQKQIKRKTEAAKTTFQWNSLFMNADAVLTSVANRIGIDKAQVLDPSSSGAAVKLAQAETFVIQETKDYFKANGVDLNAFSRKERGDTGILVKNFPFGTTESDLRKLFEEYGALKRVLMPPSGTIAIVQFNLPTEARFAFRALSYRKFKDSLLFLEKAPVNLFEVDGEISSATNRADVLKPSAAEFLTTESPIESMNTSTLFVRNLNFSTTQEQFTELFKPLEGFLSARVKTKPDTKHPGQTLSMGFGFLEFKSKDQAKAALLAMNGHNLHGHQLLIKASNKGHDAAEERRREEIEKSNKARKAKIIIKNLPFEVTRKDVHDLFKAYGQLRAVRVPRKFDNSRKGFAFAEFTTPREAENAMNALRDTHLLGRKLVLDFAASDVLDPEKEIEEMQRKVGKQSQSVAMQKLVASERRKFDFGTEQED